MAGTVAEKELRLRLTMVADAAGANRVLRELADSANKVAENSNKAATALKDMGKAGSAIGGAGGGATAIFDAARPSVGKPGGHVPFAGDWRPPAPGVLDNRKASPFTDPMKPRLADLFQPPAPEIPGSGRSTVPFPSPRTGPLLPGLPTPGGSGSAIHGFTPPPPPSPPGAKPGLFDRAAAFAGEGLGISPGMAKGAGAAAAALAVFHTTMAQQAAKQDETVPFLVGREAGKSLPLGETITGYADTLTGRRRGLARVEEQSQVEDVRRQSRVEIGRAREEAQSQQASLESRSRILGEAKPVLLPTNIDRSTAAGERQFQLESRLVQVKQKTTALDREAAVADEVKAKAAERYNALVKKGEELRPKAERAEQEFNQVGKLKDPNWAERQLVRFPGTETVAGLLGEDLDVTRQRLLKRATSSGEEYRANLEDKRKARINQAEAEAEAGRRQAEAKRGHLEVLQVRGEDLEERIRSQSEIAQKIAANPQEARQNLQNLEYFQRDPERATPDVVERARALAPKFVAKELERIGKSSDIARRVGEISEVDAPGGLDENRDELIKIKNEIEARGLKIQQELAKVLADAGRPIENVIVESIRKTFDELVNGLRTKLIAAKIPGF